MYVFVSVYERIVRDVNQQRHVRQACLFVNMMSVCKHSVCL